MRDFVEKFNSGVYIHKFNGYSPFFIGIGYGSNITLGGEEEFISCAGFFSGIDDVEWWDTVELNKLSSQQKERLNDILNRNYIVYNWIQETNESLFGTSLINYRRLSIKDNLVLRTIIFPKQTAKFLYENIKVLGLIEFNFVDKMSNMIKAHERLLIHEQNKITEKKFYMGSYEDTIQSLKEEFGKK